jgi:hypothetical protein
VPHQHGAWAFLALPVALAAPVTGWSPVLLLLVPAWVAAYPFSWALAELASARRPELYRRAAVVWLVVVAPLVAVLLALRPWLWLVGLGYALLFAVNVAFARAGAERSLANDLVLVAECTGMVPVLVAVTRGGHGGWFPVSAVQTVDVGVLSAVCAMALTGSTLHVKSLIRERRNPAATTRARVFTAACVPGAFGCALLSWPAGTGLVAVFALLALRTRWLAMRTWRPGRVGLVELAGLVLVALSGGLAV